MSSDYLSESLRRLKGLDETFTNEDCMYNINFSRRLASQISFVAEFTKFMEISIQ